MALTEKTNSMSTFLTLIDGVYNWQSDPFEDLEILQYRTSAEEKLSQSYLFLVPEVAVEDIKVIIQDSNLTVNISNTEKYPFLIGRKANIYLPNCLDTNKTLSHIEKGVLTVCIPYKKESIVHISEK